MNNQPEPILPRTNNIGADQKFVNQFLHHLPYYALLIDKKRHIVSSNNRFITDNDLQNYKDLFGKGPGDIFQCENAEANGCGNSSECHNCGIFKTLAECSQKNETVEANSKLFINKQGFIKAYEFMARCSPIDINNEQYYLLTLTDISAENRKRSLEKIFFHDVLNMVNGLGGLSLLLEEAKGLDEVKEYLEVLANTSDRLVETISSQKDLMNAEKNELLVNVAKTSSEEIIKQIVDNSLFIGNDNGKRIRVSRNSADFILYTDRVLLIRVLINMVKNALEAPNISPCITLGCSCANGTAAFYVHNHAYILEESGKHIFQPMYSTKGYNRGLGTYSMRLIGENYLKGKVKFTSFPDTGTTFTIELPIKYA